MNKHTPGPWTYRNGSRIYLDGSEVAQISFATGRLKEGRKRARFIVQACNCHDELVEALKAASVFIKNGIELGFIRMPDKDIFDPAHLAPGMIETALAKAEGGQNDENRTHQARDI